MIGTEDWPLGLEFALGKLLVQLVAVGKRAETSCTLSIIN
jgi:hypothetical protein